MAGVRWLHIVGIFLVAQLAQSSPFISYNALADHGASGRTLLQTLKQCNVSFENMNYTVLTSICKGPNYPAKQCCAAFKEFICPVVDAFNDPQSNCASTAFSYINLYGKYPPGLFANECVEGKEGLDCSAVLQSKEPTTSKASLGSPSSFLTCLTVILFSFSSVFFNFC